MPNLTLWRSLFLERLHEASRHAEKYPLDEILARLEGGENICDVASDAGLVPDADEDEHLRRDWYGYGEPDGRSRFWPDWDVEGITREAYIRALRCMLELKVPVTGYWISGIDEFAVPILPSPSQITMVMLTPTPRMELGERAEGLEIVRSFGGRTYVDPGVFKG